MLFNSFHFILLIEVFGKSFSNVPFVRTNYLVHLSLSHSLDVVANHVSDGRDGDSQFNRQYMLAASLFLSFWRLVAVSLLVVLVP